MVTKKAKPTKKAAKSTKKKTSRKASTVRARVVENETGMHGLQHMAMDTAVLTGTVSMIPMVGAAFPKT